MKRKKLLKTLAEMMGKKGRKKRQHRAELSNLLDKLQEKEHHLDQRINTEKDKQKRKRLVKELEVVKAQRVKGMKALQDLEV